MSKPWLRTQTNQSTSNDLLSAMSRQQSGLENTANDPAMAEQIAMKNVEAAQTGESVNATKAGTTALAEAGTGLGTGLGTTGLGTGLGSSYGGMGGMYGGGMGMGSSMYGGYGGMGMGMGGMYGGYGGMGMNQESSIFKAM